MTIRNSVFLPLVVVLIFASAQAADKPKLTLDEFFNSVSFTGIKLSPDGQSVVIGTDRADWDQNIFREDLWIYRDDGHAAGSLTQLTNSGYDSNPQWSPDGRWIAFLSERSGAKGGKSCQETTANDHIAQLYIISPTGGEAIPVTRGDEKVHAFAWSSDSATLYFATRAPWTKTQKEAYEKEWKDVCQYRAAERGDQVFSVSLNGAIIASCCRRR